MTNEPEPISEEEPLTAKTILIVEDDADVGDFLVQALVQETDYHPLLASNGFQALKLARGVRFDLLLLDYQLPSMDGLELYDHLHLSKEGANIPVIIMSANLPLDKILERDLRWLKKPFSLDDLLQTIEQLLG